MPPNPQHLVGAHPGNTNAARHGAWAGTGRVLAPRAAEVTEALMGAPHTVPLDVIAAEEIGALVALIEAIDKDIKQSGSRGRKALLDVRLRASSRLERWLSPVWGHAPVPCHMGSHAGAERASRGDRPQAATG